MLNIFNQDHDLAIPMGIPHVFRFRPPNENTLSELKENYIWFSDRDSLNDELDSNPEFVKLSTNPEEVKLLYNTIAENILDPQVKAYYDENMTEEKLQEFAATKIKPFVSSFGIACFTMYPMNEDLWKIYSRNDKGVCLHFDSSADPTFFHNILPVHYVSEIKEREYSAISQPNHIIDLFYKKTEKWAYEKELRLLKERTGRVKYKPSSLLNVLVGYNAEPSFVGDVVNAVKENYDSVKVFQVTEPVSIGKLSYRPLYIPK
ncbi:DUF2971 domain-containing protein [Nonlabens marinus]|uniref:DUF2971 domain-containing protein n=1 Tax=Nonlabens marinus S1-08 TaxID=1454201 RepID=W8VPT5_9FLAO|nr:DUF2971 domain-containing protein [Nonlabens marinus]BAO55229.1 hypothetical protein NMS_1220 [Nonlabens marinus S1-08]